MQSSFVRLYVIIGITLSCVRVAMFSVLVYAEWTGRQSISLVPLVLALYPEALLIRNDATLTVWAAVGFSVLLIAGSFLLAVPVAIVMTLFRDRVNR